MPAGRPRTPTEDLELRGTLRADKNGDRSLEPKFAGEPIKPRGISGDADAHWERIVPELVRRGVAKEVNTPLLELLCFWWKRLKRIESQIDQIEESGAEAPYKLVMMAATASKQWSSLATECGLTPASKSRIQGEKQGESNPFEDYLKQQLKN